MVERGGRVEKLRFRPLLALYSLLCRYRVLCGPQLSLASGRFALLPGLLFALLLVGADLI